MKEDALNVLKNLTTGMAMMIIVPNGGLGSNYNGILARGYAPPNEPLLGDFFIDKIRGILLELIRMINTMRVYTSNEE
jgi:hypothetical protein